MNAVCLQSIRRPSGMTRDRGAAPDLSNRSRAQFKASNDETADEDMTRELSGIAVHDSGAPSGSFGAVSRPRRPRA